MNRMEIDVRELATRLGTGNPPQLIDVRSPGEYAGGHIPGAMNIPLEEVEGRLADLSEQQSLVLVCQGGGRAGICYERLGERQNRAILTGGTVAWIAAGYPVVATTGTRWSLERQVRLVAGVLGLTGTVLAWVVNPLWILLSGFVGFGLTMAGVTGLCPMAKLLALLPWNRPLKSSSAPTVCQLK
jgi:rhodanese-related sulfurtransferase